MKNYLKSAAFTILLSLAGLGGIAAAENEPPRYPVLLVHGIIERTDIIYPNSSKPIAEYLNRKGVKTYIADLDALGSIETNGKVLSEIIINLCRENKIDKLNIIAFSKGGLDSRRAAHEPDTAALVASITTVSTPHRGTPAADFFSTFPLTSNRYMESFMNTVAGMAGDKQQDFIETVKQLGVDEMTLFNKKYPDVPGIEYYSFSALMKSDDYHFAFSILREYINYHKGDNDGLIPVSSARWGNYLGTANAFMNYEGSLNHPDLVGLDIYPENDFDYLQFYFKITQLLSAEGF